MIMVGLFKATKLAMYLRKGLEMVALKWDLSIIQWNRNVSRIGGAGHIATHIYIIFYMDIVRGL